MLLANGRAHGNSKMTLQRPKGFLLNTIKELLPTRRWAKMVEFRSVTGQAAWFDLKVKISKAEPDEPKIIPTIPSPSR